MPQNKKTSPNAVHDPGLVALFGRSRKSYEANVSDLLAELEAAAARTRHGKEASEKTVAVGNKGRVGSKNGLNPTTARKATN